MTAAPAPTVCRTCGASLPTRKPGPGRHRRFCSTLCRDRAKRAAITRPTRCALCFEKLPEAKRWQPGPPRLFCSDYCRHKAHRVVRPRGRWAVRRNRERVFERDDWTCQVCLLPVDAGLRFPHLQSATIDHVLATSLGGTDDEKNVQLAHFLCNIRKGPKRVG